MINLFFFLFHSILTNTSISIPLGAWNRKLQRYSIAILLFRSYDFYFILPVEFHTHYLCSSFSRILYTIFFITICMLIDLYLCICEIQFMSSCPFFAPLFHLFMTIFLFIFYLFYFYFHSPLLFEHWIVKRNRVSHIRNFNFQTTSH